MPSQAERRSATITAILAAARALFAELGFEATSIDDIALAAGVTKGAVYHHFASKEAIFVEVLDAVHRDLANTPAPPELGAIADPIEMMAAGVLAYLAAACEPPTRRILLVDGPVVIGWARWREIDDAYFGAGARLLLRRVLGPGATEREVDAATHLTMGAVMEAALACATAQNPAEKARDLTEALRQMLRGLEV
ncbi:MAG: TetR/AcrR family transcriptional regulator [Gemmatimonadales bacterium]